MLLFIMGIETVYLVPERTGTILIVSCVIQEIYNYKENADFVDIEDKI